MITLVSLRRQLPHIVEHMKPTGPQYVVEKIIKSVANPASALPVQVSQADVAVRGRHHCQVDIGTRCLAAVKGAAAVWARHRPPLGVRREPLQAVHVEAIAARSTGAAGAGVERLKADGALAAILQAAGCNRLRITAGAGHARPGLAHRVAGECAGVGCGGCTRAQELTQLAGEQRALYNVQAGAGGAQHAERDKEHVLAWATVVEKVGAGARGDMVEGDCVDVAGGAQDGKGGSGATGVVERAYGVAVDQEEAMARAWVDVGVDAGKLWWDVCLMYQAWHG